MTYHAFPTIPSEVSKLIVSNDRIDLSFNSLECDPFQVNFTASICASPSYDNDDYDDAEYWVASLKGVVSILPDELNENDACQLELAGHYYAHCALSPIYKKNGDIDDRIWKKLGGYEFDDNKQVIYLDECCVHPQIASRNLGISLVYGTAKLLNNIYCKNLPIVAILGNYDGHDDRKKHKSEVVERYFKSNGFKQIKKSKNAYYLPWQLVEKHSGLDGVIDIFNRTVKL